MTAPAVDDVARPLAEEELRWAAQTVGAVSDAVEAKVVGQELLRETLLIGLLTPGSVLVESVPGLATATAARTMAQAVGGTFHRVQCTPDLLPGDVFGGADHAAGPDDGTHPVAPPVDIVLLDEINRAAPRSQSAMLEAMGPAHAPIRTDGSSVPTLVLATQNPIDCENATQLSVGQLDRFMLMDVLDYPSPAEEADLLGRIDSGSHATPTPQVATREDLRRVRAAVRRVSIDAAITNYIVGITYVTRHPTEYLERGLAAYVRFGVSPRASIAFTAAARARAIVHRRDHVVPDDIKALAHRVLRHRVVLGRAATEQQVPVERVIDAMLAGIRTP